MKVINDKTSVKTKEIISLHGEGLSIADIKTALCHEYPTVSHKSISLILSRYGFPANKPKMPRRTDLNENYFNEINTERKAYFFGLLCADGSINTKMKRISFSLKKTDGYLVEELKREIEYSGKLFEIYPPNGSAQLKLQVYSEKMVADLFSHGCIDNKSLLIQLPTIADNLFWHFFRGYFDGNGSVSIHETKNISYKKIDICSSIDFVTKLGKVLLDKYDIRSCVSIPPGKKYGSIIISSQTSVFKISKFIYYFHTVCMSRKKVLLFKEINVGQKRLSVVNSSIEWNLTNITN